MPDRAVVDDDDVCPLNSPNFPTGHGWGHAGDDGWRDCRCGARAFDPRDVRDPALIERDRQAYEQFLRSQQPRALVALSDDRQWLVVNERWPHGTFFMIYRWDVQPNMVEPWRWVDKEDDTGQDAHQVLADFLRERGT